jgi:hypothetical protein
MESAESPLSGARRNVNDGWPAKSASPKESRFQVRARFRDGRWLIQLAGPNLVGSALVKLVDAKGKLFRDAFDVLQPNMWVTATRP